MTSLENSAVTSSGGKNGQKGPRISWFSRKKVRTVLVLLVLLAFSPMLVLFHPRARAVLRLTSGFVPLEGDERVFFESGAKVFAERFSEVLPDAVARVEACQLLPCKSGFRVYVCSSHESFTRHVAEPAGSPVRGIAFLWDIWVSPLAFEFYGKDTHLETLAHELSHLHLNQHMGWWRRSKNVPTWFLEGLADWVADTGDERISRDEAITAFRTPVHLVPDTSGGRFIRKGPRDHGLTWPMFHMQSRMFVEYLNTRNETAFKQFIADLLKGSRFDKAFENGYNDSLESIWKDFLDSL